MINCFLYLDLCVPKVQGCKATRRRDGKNGGAHNIEDDDCLWAYFYCGKSYL